MKPILASMAGTLRAEGDGDLTPYIKAAKDILAGKYEKYGVSIGSMVSYYLKDFAKGRNEEYIRLAVANVAFLAAFARYSQEKTFKDPAYKGVALETLKFPMVEDKKPFAYVDAKLIYASNAGANEDTWSKKTKAVLTKYAYHEISTLLKKYFGITDIESYLVRAIVEDSVEASDGFNFSLELR